MQKIQSDLRVTDNQRLSARACLITLESIDKLPRIFAGQFAELLVPDCPGVYLRRPISIHAVDTEHNRIEFLVQLVGKGTNTLASVKPGETINTILPLGNGFDVENMTCRHPLLIGGGIGIAPLYQLGVNMLEKGIQPTFLFGTRSKQDIILKDKYSRIAQAEYTTEDGSFGTKGFVTDHVIMNADLKKFDALYVCGPTPMMKAVVQKAAASQIDCYVSLEHKMACGLGACLCCVEVIDGTNTCVCKEGPVFKSDRLLWK